MKSLNVAYFGSSYFSANLLEHILIDKELPVNLKFVVTQPDQKAGRKQILTPTPVKITALKHKLKFLEIGNSLGQLDQLEIRNFDLILVYAYGDLIPKELLTLPKYGFWNIHPSLLPKYRGPSPIAAPLINGDKTTGVTIIKMDEEIDHGPIIAQESLTIGEDDKKPDLEKKLTNLAFKMFKKIVGERTKFFATWDIPLGEGSHGDKKIRSEPFIAQNHQEATYTKKLSKQDGFIEFKKLKSALTPNPYLPDEALAKSGSLMVYNLFRGLTPWPGIWTMVKPVQLRQLDEAKRLKITDLSFVNGKLIINKVQLEGKNEVDFETFNKAYKIF